MAKGKKKPTFKSLQGFPAELPYEDGEELETKVKDEKDTQKVDPAVAALTAKLEGMEKDMSQLRATNMALMSAAPQTTTVPTVKEISTADLPDPVDDPEGYTKELNARIADTLNSHAEVRKFEQTQAATATSQQEALWGAFKEQFPDYADKYDQVQFVAEKLVKEAVAKGLDPQKYMFQNQSGFIADVGSRLQEVFPVAATNDDSDSDDDADTTTAGIPGGLESGGKITTKAKAEEDAGTDMMDEIRDFQKAFGAYK